MLHSSHLPTNLQANQNLSVQSSILLRKPPEEICETKAEKQKSEWKAKELKEAIVWFITMYINAQAYVPSIWRN